MFVLSSLAAHKKTHVVCILCKDAMMVYDRYPLIDGTFFLSPIQHSKDCIEVSVVALINHIGLACVIKVFGERKNEMLKWVKQQVINLYGCILLNSAYNICCLRNRWLDFAPTCIHKRLFGNVGAIKKRSRTWKCHKDDDTTAMAMVVINI